jgi:hypothetical protein
LLALAGKFDGILLPAVATAHSYRVLSDEQAFVDDATQAPRLIFTRHDLMENAMIDETESEESSVKLMMMENNKDQRACITSFASGTGLAGIVGYGYKALLSDLCGWSLSATVWSAVTFPLTYYVIYCYSVHNLEQRMHQIINQSDVGQSRSSKYGLNRDDSRPVLEMVNTEILHLDRGQQLHVNCSIAPLNLTAYQRFKLVLSLWKYTIPLFTVYAAEYMLQAGVWPAIGFPVSSASARARFYQFSNWTVSGLSSWLCSAAREITPQLFYVAVPSWSVHISVFRKSVHCRHSGSLVYAVPPSPQSIFFLVELNPSVLVQLFTVTPLLCCWIAWRWCLCKFSLISTDEVFL